VLWIIVLLLILMMVGVVFPKRPLRLDLDLRPPPADDDVRK